MEFSSFGIPVGSKQIVMLLYRLTTAWWRIVSTKLYSLFNVLGLALGLVVSIVIFLLLQYEFSFDTFRPGKERIYRLVGEMRMRKAFQAFSGAIPMNSVPSPVPAAIKKEIPGLEAVAWFRFYDAAITVKENGAPKKFGTESRVVIADAAYFSIFPYHWLAGNAATSLEEPFTVVLTESRARQYFGRIPAERMIGREIRYDSIKATVSGIVSDPQGNTDFPFTDWLSFATVASSRLKNAIRLEDWGRTGTLSFCLLKLSTPTKAAHINALLSDLLARNMKNDSNYQFSLHLQPLSDIHFNEAYYRREHEPRRAHLPTLYLMAGIALIILLIAIFNFIILSTAQTIKRTKEISIRKIAGSSGKSLTLQFLLETAFLLLPAICLAVLSVNPLLTLFRSYLPRGLTFDPLSASFLFFLLSLSTITGLAAGLYPARFFSNYRPFAKAKKIALAGQQLRKTLIIFQFSVSMVFIVAVIVMHRQINFMQHEDPGFVAEDILFIYPPSNADKLAERLRHLSFVDRVCLQLTPPQFDDGGYGIPLQFKANDFVVEMRQGTSDFIPLYGIKLLAGRNLAPSDSLRELVINNTLAKQLGFVRPEKALGQLLYANGKALPVVGIIADFHTKSLHSAMQPLCIGNMPEIEWQIAIKLAPDQHHEAEHRLGAMEKSWKTLYPGEPFAYRYYDQMIAGFYEKDTRAEWLVTVAMAAALGLSCFGLLGMVVFTTEQRNREFSIRKVLGASAGRIALMLGKELGLLTGISLLIASPIAGFLLSRWLRDYAYRIPLSPGAFLLAGALTMAIALLVTGNQAWKVARANPVDNLKAE